MTHERKIVLEISLKDKEERLQEILLQELNILLRSFRGIEL
jgi:hypothetical protein